MNYGNLGEGGRSGATFLSAIGLFLGAALLSGPVFAQTVIDPPFSIYIDPADALEFGNGVNVVFDGGGGLGASGWGWNEGELRVNGNASVSFNGEYPSFENDGILSVSGDATVEVLGWDGWGATGYIDNYGTATISDNAAVATTYLYNDDSCVLNIGGNAQVSAFNGFYNDVDSVMNVGGSATIISDGDWASIANDGTITISGNATVSLEGNSYSDLYNRGTLTIGDSAAVSFKNADWIHNEGILNVGDSAVVSIEGGSWGEVYNGNDAVMNINGNASVTFINTPDFTNYGSLTIADAASLSFESDDWVYFYNEGTLDISGDANLTVWGSYDNGYEIIDDGQIVNYGTMTVSDDAGLTTVELYNGYDAALIINDSNERISVTVIANDGSLELNNSSVVLVPRNTRGYGSWLYNGGTLKLTDSSITTGVFVNDDLTELYNSQIRVTGETDMPGYVFSNYGDILLGGNSSLTLDSGATGKFGVDSRFLIAGAGNVIKADELFGEGEYWWTYDPVMGTSDAGYYQNTTFQVDGTDSATDFVDIDAVIVFTSGATWNDITYEYDFTYTKGTLNFSGVEANLSSAVYTNVVDAHFVNAIVSGNGHQDVDFFFQGSGSGVKPGSGEIGTFQGKSFTFDGATIYIDVASATEFDRLVASGNIDFTGANNVVLLNYGNTDQTFTMSFADVFQADGDTKVGDVALADTVGANVGENEILIADDEGAANSVTFHGGDQFVLGDVVFDEDGNIMFEIVGQKREEPTPQRPTNVSPNVRTLTRVITQMGSNGGNALTTAVAAYAGTSQERFVAAMNELDPVNLSLSEIFVQNAVSKFNRTNYDRLRHLQNIYSNGNGTYRGQDCNPCDPCSVFGRKSGREIWFQGLADWTNQEKTAINGYTADTYGFALGIDGRVARNTVLGVAFGGSFTKARMEERLGDAEVDSYLFSVYGLQKIDRLSISGTIGFALSDLESNRYAPKLGGVAKGERDASAFFAGLEIARRFGNRNGYLTPFLAYDYVDYSEDAFSERGTLIAMNVAEKNITSHLQTLGVRVGRQIGAFKPELTAGWLHDYGAGTVRTAGAFVMDRTIPFVVDGASRNTDRALLGAKINWDISSRANLFFRYDGEWAKDYNSQYVSAGFGLAF